VNRPGCDDLNRIGEFVCFWHVGTRSRLDLPLWYLGSARAPSVRGEILPAPFLLVQEVQPWTINGGIHEHSGVTNL
jgi:hypothetical protein